MGVLLPLIYLSRQLQRLCQINKLFKLLLLQKEVFCVQQQSQYYVYQIIQRIIHQVILACADDLLLHERSTTAFILLCFKYSIVLLQSLWNIAGGYIRSPNGPFVGSHQKLF
jgi:hypothetical protein